MTGLRVLSMTLGDELERDRLTRRAQSVSVVVAELRRQVGSDRAEAHPANRYLLDAIAKFETELAAIDARVIDLAARAHSARNRRDVRRDGSAP
jgi:hypothetical protein